MTAIVDWSNVIVVTMDKFRKESNAEIFWQSKENVGIKRNKKWRNYSLNRRKKHEENNTKST